jgi:hypothetical protein
VKDATAHIKNLAAHEPLDADEVDAVLRGWPIAATVAEREEV